MTMLGRSLRTGLLVSALVLAASSAAHAAALGQINEFATPTMASGPEGMVAGPDGSLWFAQFGVFPQMGQTIAEINPVTHAISTFQTPTLNSGPLGVALGPDGNIWFTEYYAGKIGEINPTTHAISEYPIPSPTSFPVAIVAGPNGNLWFTESGGASNTGKIGEINPTTHAFTEFAAPTASVQPFGITVGPDGNIWFTEKDTGGTNSRIGYITTTGTASDFATPTTSAEPNAIAPGPDGSLWFTEQEGNAVVLLNPSTHAMMPFTTPTDGPVVIAPGPDGNMWFTEGANPGEVAFINPVTHVITQFPTPTANSGPVGITTGPDGNLWFTETGVAKIGVVGAGAPAAVVSPPAVTGDAQPANDLTCQGATWSTWAAQQPSLTEYGFDGYRWLRNGSQIPGATTSSYAVAATDVGHQISCEQIATYPLLNTTVITVSAPVTIYPTLGASLTSTSASGATASVSISCQGLPSQSCTGGLVLTSRVTTQGSKTIAVAAASNNKKKKPKPKPKKITKTETVASGSYSVAAGTSATIKLALNSTGKKLLTAFYRLPAMLTINGTWSGTRPMTLSYGRLHISPAYTWAFSSSSTYATELTLSGLPSGSKVTVICHGGGCPFSKRTYSAPKNRKLALAPALKRRHLSPRATVELEISASNDVSEVVIFTVRSGQPPTESFRCMPPGAHSPSACV